MTADERAGEPYLPASGTEGADFVFKWCANCKQDEATHCGGDGCDILAQSYCGIEPSEWQLWRGEPMCSAFEPVAGADYPHMSGNAVADLFPASRHRPTTGEQIRLLVGSALDHHKAP